MRRPVVPGDPLTPRQAEIFDFIKSQIVKGMPPTVREIGLRFGFSSTTGVVGHLKSLVLKGVIERDPVIFRGIRLAGRPRLNIARDVGLPCSLTPRQEEVFRYILDRISEGSPPALREIASHFGFTSWKGVSCHLLALEKKGFIRRPVKGRGRGIEVIVAHPEPNGGAPDEVGRGRDVRGLEEDRRRAPRSLPGRREGTASTARGSR